MKVAVIDLGFSGYAARQASGDLPSSLTTVDFCGGSFGGSEVHGTAVAEIVHEVSPDAALVLICVNSEVTLGQAKDYAKANGISVVNHSVGWFNSSRGDGSGGGGTPDAIVADARANGILWVNAAGNYATKHWSGVFQDFSSPPDGLHDFAPGDSSNAFLVGSNATVCASLKWDDWPVSSQDYDLFLLRLSDGVLLARSDNFQSGSQPPTEDLCYSNGVSQLAAYIAITRYSATITPRFDLFVYGNVGPLEYQVAQGSIVEPASSSNALAVGAICWQTNGLESYSSQGPTIGGVIKPDVGGQDSVSSATYGAFSGCGISGFTGTSAASPHVAGAAALIKQANPSFGPVEAQTFIESHAIDLGTPGKDNLFGSGRLWLGTAPVPIVQCASVGMTPSPAGPQPPGTSVTLTATSGGCTSAEYKFWVRAPGASSFTMLRDYGAAAVTWNTTGLASGTYTFGIWARAVGSSAAVDVGMEQDYLLQTSASPCTSVGMTPNPAGPRPPGTSVTLTANSTGCSSAEYKFWLRPPGNSSFTVLREYGAAAFTWDTTGLATGTYTFGIWARATGSSAIVDVGMEQAYLLQSSAPCASVSMTPSPPAPQPPGTSVTLTASSTGCSSAEYKFWVRAPNTSSFTMLRDYGGATFIWDTSGIASGTYTFGIWARAAGSSTVVDVGMEQVYSLQASAPCASVSMIPSPGGPQPPGTSVALTASSTGCSSVEYKFWVRPPGASSFTMLRDYGAAMFTWDTTGLAPGTYTFGVWARAAGSSTVVDVGMEQAYLLQSSPPCASVSMTPNPASPNPPGTSVTLTAGSSGCTSAEYKFWVRPPGASSFTMLRDYGASGFTWDTTGLISGTYTFGVWARAAGSSTVVDVGMEQTYLLQSSPPCNSVSMTPTPASPQPSGTSVTLTASSTGCTSGEYRFWVRDPGASSFTMLRDYGAATFVWDTTGLGQGTYTFSVWARATGSSTVVDWGMEQDYVLGP